MKLNKIFYVLLSIGLLTSCESQLEINPTDNIPGELAFGSEANISGILVGTYEEAGQSATYGGRLQLMTNMLGATTESFWLGTFIQPRQAFTKQLLVDNSFVAGIWFNAYETINQANLVIDNLATVTSSTEESNRIEGEAKFLRALNYFDLVRNFGSPFVAGQANTQLGVPLRITGIIDYSVRSEISRNTVDQVYAQVISDANDAYSLLPANNSFYADKYAAKALLARVYFQQGNYPAARDAAHDVLQNSGHSLTPTYAEAFNNDVDSDEDIFTFQVTSQTGTNQLVNHYASELDGGRGGDVRIEPAYLNLFTDPNDQRRNFTYINPANNRRLTLKFTNQFGNLIIFRIGEMHLIRAEGNFRLNTVIGLPPLTEINALRGRSTAAPLVAPLTLASFAAERNLELAFEQGFILHDAKRTQTSIGSRAWNANELVFPIPENEMDTNPLMVQNAGYTD
jgi:hypothetical protein